MTPVPSLYQSRNHAYVLYYGGGGTLTVVVVLRPLDAYKMAKLTDYLVIHYAYDMKGVELWPLAPRVMLMGFI